MECLRRMAPLAICLAAAGCLRAAAEPECLARPAEQITVLAPGRRLAAFEASPPGDFHVYDMRAVEFAANPPLKPIKIERNLNGVCVVGPRVVGQQSRELSWSEMKHRYDGDGLRFVNKSGGRIGRVLAQGLWIDNVEDGFEPVRYASTAGKGYSWSLRSSYFRYIRDDVIENDACHPGEVVDVLVDDSRTFLSTRPSRGKYLHTGAAAPVIEIRDSAIHVGAAGEARAGGGAGRIWKWPGSASDCTPRPVVDVRDTVFRVDLPHDGRMGFPEGSYRNVTLVWLGGGSYPVPVPEGVSVTDDPDVWHRARNAWLERHGCDATGDVCTHLVPGAASPAR